MNGEQLVIHCPDGGRFMTYLELSKLADRKPKIAERETKRADKLAHLSRQIELRAATTKRADDAERLVMRFRAQLRAAGLDPDDDVP